LLLSILFLTLYLLKKTNFMPALAKTSKSNQNQNQNQNNSGQSAADTQSSTLVDNRPATLAQMKLADGIGNGPGAKKTAQLQDVIGKSAPVQKKENSTGLPDNLKSGIENLSGVSLDDVKVHTNSDQPAQMQAHAFAQGTDIHVAPGQEQHLPHEAWHVVQQKQGRVKPTTQLKGEIPVNDDKGLEHEADVMGAKALSLGSTDILTDSDTPVERKLNNESAPVQGIFGYFENKPDEKSEDEKYLEEFKANSKGGWTGKRGAGVQSLDTLVMELSQAWTGKSHPKVKIKIIETLITDLENWITYHDGERSQSDRVKYFKLYKNRCKEKLDELHQIPEDAMNQPLTENEEGQMKKLSESHEGRIDTMITGKLGTMVKAAIPHNGDSAEISLDLSSPDIPIGPGVTGKVSGSLGVSAEKDDDKVTLGANIGLTGGVEFVKLLGISVSLKGFIKATGADESQALDLMSLGFYKKAREAKAMPDAVTNSLWGGSGGSLGFAAAEKKSSDTEKAVLDEYGPQINSKQEEVKKQQGKVTSLEKKPEELKKAKHILWDLQDELSGLQHDIGIKSGWSVGAEAYGGIKGVAKASGSLERVRETAFDATNMTGVAKKNKDSMRPGGEESTSYTAAAGVEIAGVTGGINYTRSGDNSDLSAEITYKMPVNGKEVASKIIGYYAQLYENLNTFENSKIKDKESKAFEDTAMTAGTLSLSDVEQKVGSYEVGAPEDEAKAEGTLSGNIKVNRATKKRGEKEYSTKYAVNIGYSKELSVPMGPVKIVKKQSKNLYKKEWYS
jgi:hypothetical protein